MGRWYIMKITMKKLTKTMGMAALFVFMLAVTIYSASAATIVKDVFSKSYNIDATNFYSSSSVYKSCNVQENWESGKCSYLYACGVVVPKGSNSLKEAIYKECIDITDTGKGDIQITFTPPKGSRLAVVTFLVHLKKSYNYNTYEWKEDVEIPSNYRSGEEAISLCADGMMLKDNLCYSAQSVCLNTFSTNLCDNPYNLYMLDYGYGFNINRAEWLCADRDEDLVCDNAVSLLCPDKNNNGVCDADDTAVKDVGCVDENKNFVCDDVESEGVFCRTYYEPVHAGVDGQCVTFPNSCFAEASGYSDYVTGTCEPVYGDFCFSNNDCTSPCDGVSGICKNPDGLGNRCFYSGECNPRNVQCSKDADCPKSPCVGSTFQCTSQNTCVPVGKCISQPTASLNWWDKIWASLKNWISGIFK